MANGLFNIYDARANERDDLEKSAMQFANLSPGRGMVAASTQAGGMFGQGARDLLGGMSPEEAKAQKIKTIMSKYATADRNDPSIYRQMINEFTSAGLLEEAQEAASILKQMDSITGGTSMMKNIRDIAENELNCSFTKGDPNYTPTCYKDATEIYRNTKRAGVGEKFAVEDAKSFNKAKDRAYELEAAGDQTIAEVNQSLAMIDDIYTGTQGDAIQVLKRFGDALGFDTGAAEGEMLRVNTMKQIMKWIALTKGAISEGEMRAFEQASPGLAKTKAGNRLILETLKRAAEYQKNMTAEMDRWYLSLGGRVPSMSEWQTHLRQWKKENALKLPTASQISEAKKGNYVEGADVSTNDFNATKSQEDQDFDARLDAYR